MRKTIYILSILLFAPDVFAGALDAAMETAASGMRAQSQRIKIVTENIANEDTTGLNPNEAPYQRKTIFFEEAKDPVSGADIVKVKKIGRDDSPSKLVYLPDHPAANEEGYVKMPNVDKNLESMDIRDAQRSYEANISVIETTKQIQERTLDLMR